MSLAFAQKYKGKKIPNPLTSPDEHSAQFGLKDWGPSLTKQSEAESCDINLIVKRYEQTGLLPEKIAREPIYGEFADAPTYMEAQNIISQANAQFALLPAETRAFFMNDPSRFLDYIDNAPNDKKKAEKLIELELGTLVQPKAEDPNLTALKEIAKNTAQKRSSTASKEKDDPE